MRERSWKRGRPLTVERGGEAFTHAKDDRPWKLLQVIEGLQGGAPKRNLLLWLAEAPGFPDVLHSQGR